MNMNHTPGPWRVLHVYDERLNQARVTVCTPHRYAADGEHISEEHIADCGVPARATEATNQAQANARLIAAAPELLASLQRIVAWADAGCNPSPKSIEVARALIKRVTNERTTAS